ncbi:hypothetical protein WR25_03309 [Diploscapter pachys]|uniref:Uncharacterized protein n=1 Tax=Diploscapter pachys TaxID=2018661 RepID=A0A2A2L3J4_9BILA|nr:hypothetical protein WR25_03309 [Diploscapter pachys]
MKICPSKMSVLEPNSGNAEVFGMELATMSNITTDDNNPTFSSRLPQLFVGVNNPQNAIVLKILTMERSPGSHQTSLAVHDQGPI